LDKILCVPASELGRQLFLGEHRELYCIVGALLGKYEAYSHHRETLCFKNHIDQSIIVTQCKRKKCTKEATTQFARARQQPTHSFTEEDYSQDHLELMKRQEAKKSPVTGYV
jgi:Pyrimidine dimer DNA glycosylase